MPPQARRAGDRARASLSSASTLRPRARARRKAPLSRRRGPAGPNAVSASTERAQRAQREHRGEQRRNRGEQRRNKERKGSAKEKLSRTVGEAWSQWRRSRRRDREGQLDIRASFGFSRRRLPSGLIQRFLCSAISSDSSARSVLEPMLDEERGRAFRFLYFVDKENHDAHGVPHRLPTC